MGQLRLSPDECLHCKNARGKARERCERDGATAEWIKAYLPTVLCPGHTAENDERERREKRNARRRKGR